VSPLLLPILIPAAIIWFFVSRNRKQRAAAVAASAQTVQAA
jgi:preprotein translocase subunit YajC